MPVGIEIYRDGAAAPYFNAASGFLLGHQDISAAVGASGTITDVNLLNGHPFFFQRCDNFTQQLDVTFSGADLNWSAPDGYTGTIFWGIR